MLNNMKPWQLAALCENEISEDTVNDKIINYISTHLE